MEQNTEINPYTHSQISFEKGSKTINEGQSF